MRYLTYFLYLSWHWNIRLAIFIIRHEIKGEKKYGISTVGIDDLKTTIPAEVLEHASVYQPINYYIAEQLFEQLVLEDIQGALLDLGCGKGRVIAIAAAYGFKEIIGIDFSPALCEDAEAIATMVMDDYEDVKVKIECVDAANYTIPTTVSTVFLFNPFDALIMQEVIKQLQKSQQLNPREIKILYANPVCKQSFFNAGFVETFHVKRMEYLEGSVFEKVMK